MEGIYRTPYWFSWHAFDLNFTLHQKVNLAENGTERTQVSDENKIIGSEKIKHISTIINISADLTSSATHLKQKYKVKICSYFDDKFDSSVI
jgi:hypothetical protein